MWMDKVRPGKFPPDQYYLDQIKQLSNVLDDPPLYIHIFTDYESPYELVKKYDEYLKMNNIEFGYTPKGESGVVIDLFNMIRFDCFIASLSTFAFAAQLLGEHKIIINPSHLTWQGKKLIVDEVKISLPDRINHIAKQYRFDGDVSHLHNEIKAALIKE